MDYKEKVDLFIEESTYGGFSDDVVSFLNDATEGSQNHLLQSLKIADYYDNKVPFFIALKETYGGVDDKELFSEIMAKDKVISNIHNYSGAEKGIVRFLGALADNSLYSYMDDRVLDDFTSTINAYDDVDTISLISDAFTNVLRNAVPRNDDMRVSINSLFNRFTKDTTIYFIKNHGHKGSDINCANLLANFVYSINIETDYIIKNANLYEGLEKENENIIPDVLSFMIEVETDGQPGNSNFNNVMKYLSTTPNIAKFNNLMKMYDILKNTPGEYVGDTPKKRASTLLDTLHMLTS